VAGGAPRWWETLAGARDEPPANLDHATDHYQVIDLMKKMRDTLNNHLPFSTHDTKIVGEAETVFRLEDGMLAGVEDKGEAGNG
jgi:putative ABC transport system ATP-binding protein